MRFKRILSVALTAALIGSSSVLAVSAKTSAPDDTYNYVAFGDSIAAGYGLGASDDPASKALDPALILSQKLIDNPVKEAYAAVFGEYLKTLGEKKGLTVNATNLSSTAYRAEDVAATILTEGYKGEVAEYILNTFVAPGTGEVLTTYHGLYNKYLPDADLVSIQLGGNDIVMSILYPMIKSDNVIYHAISTSMALVLFGCDMKTALGAGLLTLQNNKDNITYQDLAETAQYFAGVLKNATMYVENSAASVGGVVDAVREVNADADIALIGMYNPYGNSLVCDGTTYDLSTVVSAIFTRAAEELCGCQFETPDVELVDDDELDDKTEDSVEHLKVLSKLSETMHLVRDYAQSVAKSAADALKAKIVKLLDIVKEEISYPLQYLTAGKNTDPQMKLLNEKLAALADEKGLTFVDVYNISNENNLDPHPLAKGHREIAEIMEDVLADVVETGMNADKTLKNISTIAADTIQLGSKVKVRGVADGGTGDYQYAFYYKKATSEKWVRVHDFSEVRAVNIIPAKAVDYDVLVKVRDNTGKVVEKTFTLTVTK